MNNELSSDRISQAGLDMEKISRTSVLLKVGDIKPELLRQHPVFALCRSLGAIGIGSLHLCGSPDYFDCLDDIMGNTVFVQHPGIWLTEELALMSPKVDMIIDLTNNFGSNSYCGKLSLARKCPLFTVMWGDTWVAVNSSRIIPGELKMLPARMYDKVFSPVSRIACGLALQEILMCAGNADLAAPLEGTVIYKAAEDRMTAQNSRTIEPVENVVIEVVGAGAIGVHFLGSIIPVLGANCELRIFDPDEVGIENLALQSPYIMADVGNSKAVVIAEKLMGLRLSNVNILPFAMSYQDRSKDISKPTVRVVCADNFAVRKYANDLSVNDGICLMETGSVPMATQIRAYYPGMTACLEHRIRNLSERVEREKEAVSCTKSLNPTLPGTNMIAGGILAIEVLKSIAPDRFGKPSKGVITYDARIPQRFAVTDIRQPCNCFQNNKSVNSHVC